MRRVFTVLAIVSLIVLLSFLIGWVAGHAKNDEQPHCAPVGNHLVCWEELWNGDAPIHSVALKPLGQVIATETVVKPAHKPAQPPVVEVKPPAVEVQPPVEESPTPPLWCVIKTKKPFQKLGLPNVTSYNSHVASGEWKPADGCSKLGKN